MKNYVIIDADVLHKRIQELEKEYILLSNKSDRSLSDLEEEREIIGEQRALSNLLSQSTPLISEIEKYYDAGSYNHHSQYTEEYNNLKQKDISKLKLDI